MTKQKYIENVKPTKEKGIRINNRDIEKVNQFIYLGSNIIPFVLLTVTKQCLQYSKFNYSNTCTLHPLLFCTMTNQCTINWQSIIIYQLNVHWLVIVQNNEIKKNNVCWYCPIQRKQFNCPYCTTVRVLFYLPCRPAINLQYELSNPKRSKCTKTSLHTDINLVQLFKS
jgi:hypothetical protein